MDSTYGKGFARAGVTVSTTVQCTCVEEDHSSTLFGSTVEFLLEGVSPEYMHRVSTDIRLP